MSSGSFIKKTETKIKVAHLIDAQGGGALTHILTLARNIPKEKVALYIIFFVPGPVLELARQSGISVIIIRKYFPIDITLIWRLYRFLKRNNIQLMHTHTINSNFYGRISARLANIPVVTTMHSYMIDELAGLKTNTKVAMLFFRMDKLLSRLSTRFIAVSTGIRKRLLDCGISSDKIDIISHGIDFLSLRKRINLKELKEIKKELGIQDSYVVVAIVGRLVPVKNHDIFLKAAKEVLNNKAEVKFLVVGDGILKEELVQLCSRLKIENNVVFTGWRNDLDILYQIIDILVLCSSTESFGLVLAEAMAHSKAVIATNIDEISNIVIHEKTGLLIHPEDVYELAHSIEKLIDDPLLRKRLGERGRVHVEKHYSVDVMTDSTVNLYQQVLQDCAN